MQHNLIYFQHTTGPTTMRNMYTTPSLIILFLPVAVTQW